MNRIASLIPATALALVLGLPAFAQTAQAAPAATAPATASTAPSNGKVGIVNIQAAIVNSNEGQRDIDALQKKFDPKRQELEGLKKNLEELQNKFTAQADKLNDEARNELLKQIDTKKKQLQRSMEDAQADFQTQEAEIGNRIGQKLMSVLDKYAKDHDYVTILDISGQQSPVLWYAGSVDITKPVLDAYNVESGVAAPANASAKPAGSAAPAAPSAPKSAAGAVSKK